MSNEEIPYTVAIDDATAVQFDCVLLRQPMHDEQLIEWIFQGGDRDLRIRKRFGIHQQRRSPELLVHDQTLVRAFASYGRLEIKLKVFFVFVQSPDRTRIKDYRG